MRVGGTGGISASLYSVICHVRGVLVVSSLVVRV